PLQYRGLVNITGHAKSWAASITETGTYYLEHGAYPLTDPANSAHKGGGPALTHARALIKQLQHEGMITISDPDEQTRARYRQTLHACRAHHLAPEGQELRFTGRNSGDIIIQLGSPSSAEKTDWNRIRLNARKVTTNLDALRSALETSSILDQLSEALRP